MSPDGSSNPSLAVDVDGPSQRTPAGNAGLTSIADTVVDVVPIPSTATGVKPVPTRVPKAFKHPLDPLTPDEIAAVSLSIRHHITHTLPSLKALKFLVTSLVLPPKRAVLTYLGIPLVPRGRVSDEERESVGIVRKAESDFLDVVNGHTYNAVVELSSSGEWTVRSLTQLPGDKHPQISPEELIAAELVVRNNPIIQQLAKDVGVEPHQIFCDGWSIGYDDRFPQHRRVQQGLVFARFSEHDNLYAHPMDFMPIIDIHTEELLHVDFPPHYVRAEDGSAKLSVETTHPTIHVSETALKPVGLTSNGHATNGDTTNGEDTTTTANGTPPTDHPIHNPHVSASLTSSNRPRIPPPRKAWDFLPDLMAQTEEGGYNPRKDIKPLHVVQPEGVSFKMEGHVLEWQNWKMHISFTHREGIALSTITYNDNGEIRPIFYRLSLAEMVVPYGPPEFPHPRKFAFDSGEYGMGTMANELSLGCDCLGQIHYLPGAFVGYDGSAVVIKNVICIHEEDNGVLWKHTDYRPNGRSQTVRRRRLVVSMVCTLANYEYIWNYHFYQDGSIEFEIRLTGILSVYVAADNEPTPFGTTVAPNINAHYHQHMFSIRVDPMVDGLANTVLESDVIPLDAPTGSIANYAGNAFVVVDTPVKNESGRAYDFEKERRWRVVNRGRRHYASGAPVGYSLGVKGGATPMMSKMDGWAAKRAKMLSSAVWVVKDVEEDEEGERGGSGTVRMWPAGKYVPQTREEPEDSVGRWVEGGLGVEDEDLLVFLTVGTTHIPRPEDWPVMPAENLVVSFKPISFFKANPSMDVPGTNDHLSVPAFEDPKPNGTDGASQGSCCQNGQ